MCQENFLELITAMRPMILDSGHNPVAVDQWIANAKDELRTMQKHIYMNVRS